MKRLATLFVLIGMTAFAAQAEACGFLRKPGSDTVFSKVFSKLPATTMCLPKSCAMVGKNCGAIDDGCGDTLECGTCSGIDTCGGGGTANVCGQTCYNFAYLAEESDGLQDVFKGGNCLSTPENLTHNTIPVEHSHLTSGRGEANVAFLQSHDDQEWVNLMNMARKSWNLLDHGSPSQFEPKAVAWDASGRLAILSKENDGSYALRLNEGPYYTADRSLLVQRFGMVPPQDMEWVPIPGETRFRYLIVSFGSFPSSSSFYALDTAASPIRRVSLEETTPGSPRLHALRGSQPATGRLGTSLLFVRGDRILSCNLDLSHMGDAAPRAYCPNAWETTQLRDIDGEMASPSVSHDNQWLFFSMKRDPSSRWDIYRSRFDRFQLHQMTATPDIDEKEIASLAPWFEVTAMPVQATAMTVREEPQYVASVYQTAVQTIQTRCTTDAECPAGQECDEGVCRAP